MWAAMGGYGVVALLACFTLDRLFRILIWILCGGLAVMTLARAKYGKDG
jgi:hypothetical protein